MAPTREIVTPKTNTKVVVKEWVTGGEFEDLQKSILDGVKVGTDGEMEGSIEMSRAIDQNSKALALVVVSVNGSTGDVVKTLRDLPRDDYQFVLDEVNGITNPKGQTQSGTSTKSS